MNVIDLTSHKFKNDRSELRKELTGFFLEEQPGSGKGELASRHKYIVKKIGEHEIYLQRPARFNNGFDFTLNVSGINFNAECYNDKGKLKPSTTRPSHPHIISDLKLKKDENPILYSELLKQVEKIYNCQEPSETKFAFSVGYDSEIILECIKWLFAEQDITYWYYSGREMLYNGIMNI